MAVFIDIGNTLWNFGAPLYVKLYSKGYNILPSRLWDCYFTKGFVPDDEFYNAINEVHEEQNNYKPYAYVKEFLKNLKDMGYTIIATSNKSHELYFSTYKWLEKNNIIFDDLILSDDKRKLFNKNTEFVVDDSPIVLEHALKLGIPATGLLFNWNKYLMDKITLHKTLKHCSQFIKTNFAPKNWRLPTRESENSYLINTR
ncbi:hypothetical protein DESAMIL20_1186 [Desulfurella amilsii]|uniref:Uncharacterized protein n=1 Tax=Desulfurella amilsii TaxID=1562698 RepID=A0A1X4XVR0_9BACT|nr:hypothetical protein [Desulfurella amilsii]OSS41633.1 hypothetical protein DESAMIL20_1186 [Desulfurella amilsii]